MLKLAQYGEQYLEATESNDPLEAAKAKKNYINQYANMMRDNEDY